MKPKTPDDINSEIHYHKVRIKELQAEMKELHDNTGR